MSREDEDAILDLLYILAYWSGLAKFCMHTDSSLQELESATTALGNLLRHFADVVCPHYKTFETDSKVAAVTISTL